MSDAASEATSKQMRVRLRQLKAHFEQREKDALNRPYREPTIEEKDLFSEYLHLHYAYGGPHPDRESGLVVFYRKLLRLQEATGK